MAIIEIKNIGPIKEAKFDLNKVNVFMGPQSSGKSTIAKIISYCTWVEKDVATSQSLDTYQENKSYFKENLESFHKIKGYFKPDSYISYTSDVVAIKWEDEQCVINWVDRYAYKRSKISYIPAERNIITLPEVKKIEFGNTNIRSFLFDWFDARKNYSKEKSLSILGLDVDYYFAEGSLNEEDHIRGKNDKGREYNILLSNASSGLQSITPLIVIIDYLTNLLYKENKTSFEIEEKQRKTSVFLTIEKLLKPYFGERFSDERTGDLMDELLSNISKNQDAKARETLLNYFILTENFFKPHNSQFIIEEPEQNLFPETQRNAIYYLLSKITDPQYDHKLTITTHSPYILYALNNCMMGGLVYDKMNDQDKKKIKCRSALIKPEMVSVYEIHNGVLKSIQQEDNLIGTNYLDQKMKDLMDDFYVMLNYYE